MLWLKLNYIFKRGPMGTKSAVYYYNVVYHLARRLVMSVIYIEIMCNHGIPNDHNS